jgi:CheY-like chemotaxis protein
VIFAVDDELHRIKPYLEDLSMSGFSVASESQIDAAWSFFVENRARIELCILDVMMAPGTCLAGCSTNDGTRTGVAFFELLRKSNPAMPVVILTNVSAADVRKRCDDDDLCWWFRKDEIFPFELSEKITDIVGQVTKRP